MTRSQNPCIPALQVEEVTDPLEMERSRSQLEKFRRNSEWLRLHWDALLPAGRGKFLAVAGQQAFLADTPEEAWQQARAAHPDDDGAFSSSFPRNRGRVSMRLFGEWWTCADGV